MVDKIYPSELQLHTVNSSDVAAPFLYLNPSVSNGKILSKICNKRDDFGFGIVNVPFLDSDVPRSFSYEYIFLNFFVSLALHLMSAILTVGINALLLSFLSRAIRIINFGMQFQNFFASTPN